MSYKLVEITDKEWRKDCYDGEGKYVYAYGHVFEENTGNPVIFSIDDGEEKLHFFKVIKED